MTVVLRMRIDACRKAFCPEEIEEQRGENSANAVIRREYAKLGPITYVFSAVFSDPVFSTLFSLDCPVAHAPCLALSFDNLLLILPL